MFMVKCGGVQNSPCLREMPLCSFCVFFARWQQGDQASVGVGVVFQTPHLTSLTPCRCGPKMFLPKGHRLDLSLTLLAALLWLQHSFHSVGTPFNNEFI